MKEKLNQFREWYRNLSDKKKHVEFITAVLSVPVMLTVIIINLNNLSQQKNNAAQKTTTEKVAPIQIVITGEKDKANNSVIATPMPTSQPGEPTYTPAPCIKEVGVVSILFPRESEVVTTDPVCITLTTQSHYCSVLWSYKLNDGDWSDFMDKNVCLHNLTNGTKTVQMKIKSSQSSDQVVLQRSFIYKGNAEPTAQPTIATSSAGM
jgi:hypothetical protein